MLILYVDDEPGLLEMGKLLLERSGEFHVDTCTSARAALEILNKKNYDIVISDYLMPEMDGIEFLKIVRATGSTLPFIIFTGRGTEKIVIDALNNGADFYLQKGEESKVLFAELTHAIRQSVLMRQNYDKLGQKEQALRESEEKFRTLVEYALDGILILDLTGKILFANQAAGKIIEADNYRDMIGVKNVLEWIAPESQQDAIRDFSRVAQGIDGYIAQYRLITAQRRERWVESIGKNILFGGIQAILISLRDITDRRQAEEALRESEQKFRAMVEQSNEGIIIVDFSGILLFANRRAMDIIENASDEDVTGKLNVLDFVSPELRKDAIRDFIQVSAGTDRYLVNYKIITLSKKERWIECIGKKIAFKGSPAMLLSFRDVTERRQMEEELRASEDRYRRLVENANEAILVIQDGRICFVNPKLEEIGMYTKEELAAKPFLEFVHPEDRAMVGEQHNRRLAGENLQHSYTIRVLSRNGSVLWMEINSSLITWEKRLAVLVLLSDITERKQAVEALRQSEEKYRSIIENIQDVYYRTDAAGNLLFVSPSAEKMFGYSSASEFYGKNIAETLYYKPEDRQKFLAELNKNGSVTEYEVMLKKLDGTPLLVSTSSHKYCDSSGKYLGVEGIFRDITDRKRAEDVLRESEEKYRALFENTGTAMALIEENTIISLVNAELERLSEYSKQEIEGKKSWKEFIVKEDLERMLVQHRLRRENRDAALRNYEFRVNTKSGRTLNALLTIDIIPGTKRSIASMIDITEQKQTEKAFSQAIKKLNLLSSITRHDILNQLTVLEGYLALSEGSLDETAVLAEYIQKEIKAAKIIERMIGFTRDYQDMGVNAPFWQNVNTSIGKAAAAFPLRKIRVEIDRTDLEVFADPLLERVFYNLIDNTLKHGGEKITTIRFSFHESDQWMNIVYEDDGVGVSGDMKKYLFVRGFGKHTGFGLYLIREILDITGITIRETGEPGKGARFEILVPKGIYRIIRP
jgi:PAS domain S-box-containing protein